MSIKSAPFYWLVCDGCGRSAQESSDVSAWLQQDVAVDEAVADGWWVASEQEDPAGKDYCDDCGPKRGIDFCDGCGDLQRVTKDAAGDRSCQGCTEAAPDVEAERQVVAAGAA